MQGIQLLPILICKNRSMLATASLDYLNCLSINVCYEVNVYENLSTSYFLFKQSMPCLRSCGEYQSRRPQLVLAQFHPFEHCPFTPHGCPVSFVLSPRISPTIACFAGIAIR
ncbi:hypothetical protein M758_8G143500 [Ceratodon purpureus]|nr:hypothetical protein M758_8G143500 [Ceratodon purpureus]